MNPEDRLREASKQLHIVSKSDEITDVQAEAAESMRDLVENLATSIENCRDLGLVEDGQLVTDGGTEPGECSRCGGTDDRTQTLEGDTLCRDCRDQKRHAKRSRPASQQGLDGFEEGS